MVDRGAGPMPDIQNMEVTSAPRSAGHSPPRSPMKPHPPSSPVGAKSPALAAVSVVSVIPVVPVVDPPVRLISLSSVTTDDGHVHCQLFISIPAGLFLDSTVSGDQEVEFAFDCAQDDVTVGQFALRVLS